MRHLLEASRQLLLPSPASLYSAAAGRTPEAKRVDRLYVKAGKAKYGVGMKLGGVPRPVMQLAWEANAPCPPILRIKLQAPAAQFGLDSSVTLGSLLLGGETVCRHGGS